VEKVCSNGDFVRAIDSPHPPDKLARHILDRYAKPTDDALVLVARWRMPVTAQEGRLS